MQRGFYIPPFIYHVYHYQYIFDENMSHLCILVSIIKCANSPLHELTFCLEHHHPIDYRATHACHM